MCEIEFFVENGLLTVKLAGRIDSVNAAQAEEKIMEALACEHDKIILDFDKLEYISSAGLRVILRVRKEEPTLRIINVSSEVYDVFDMTGFTEMVKIEKSYRTLSVDDCEVVGVGANGKVYRLDSDTIIKVYLNPDCLDDIRRERELARKAFVLGVPTAIPYDIVRVGDGYGSVFELLNSKSLAKLLNAEPENYDKYVNMYVDLMKKIHSTEVKPEDMPDMRTVVIDWVKFLKPYLPENTYNKLLSMVEAVPVVHNMMHGDYHIKNVMLQNDEALLIDMDTLCQGHPIFELASVFNAYIGFSEADENGGASFLGIKQDVAVNIWNDTLKLYFGDRNDIDEIEKKAKVVGYTRLMRRKIRRKGLETDEGLKAVNFYKDRIIELVDQIDSLTY